MIMQRHFTDSRCNKNWFNIITGVVSILFPICVASSSNIDGTYSSTIVQHGGLTVEKYPNGHPISSSSSSLASSPSSSPEQQQQQQLQKETKIPASCVHIINLDRDATRWESVTSGLMGSNNNNNNDNNNGGDTATTTATASTTLILREDQIRRLVAVYGKELSQEELRENTTWISRHFVTRGTIGCYLSHRKFWESTLQGNEDYQICFEDDIVVVVAGGVKGSDGGSGGVDCDHHNHNNNNNLLTRVEELIDELEEALTTKDEDWDVIFLGALGCVHPNGKFGLNRIAGFMSGGGRKRKRISKHFHVPRRPLGAHAYILSKRGAKKLLQGAWTVTGHVDVVAWGMSNLNVYCIDPMIVYQGMEAQSTIGAITKGMETKLPRIVVDEYTGIRFEWIFNAPVLQLGPVLLTMGRSVVYILGGYIVAWLLRERLPLLLPIHSLIFAILFVLTKATTIPRGMPVDGNTSIIL